LTSTPENQVFKFKSPDDSPGFLLWQFSNLWQRKMNAGLNPLGLTHVQFVLLAGLIWLNQSQETVTQTKLAAHAKTDIMMTSKVLRSLEKRGLLKREPNLKDTRAKSLTITQKGYELTLEAIKVVDQIDNKFFSALEQQLENFNQSLRSIRDSNKLEDKLESEGWDIPDY